MKVRIAENKYIIEKAYSGCRCMAHKCGKEVKLFNSSKDTFKLSSLNPLIVGLSNRDFLVDGVLVAYHNNNPLGKAAIKDILLNGKIPPSVNVKFHIFDMVYYDGVDLSEFPLNKRKALLMHLRFNDLVKNVYSIIVTSQSDLEKSTKLFCSMKGSEGAVIKEYGSTYTMSEWYLYNKSQRLKAVILATHELESSFYFTVGIH